MDLLCEPANARSTVRIQPRAVRSRGTTTDAAGQQPLAVIHEWRRAVAAYGWRSPSIPGFGVPTNAQNAARLKRAGVVASVELDRVAAKAAPARRGMSARAAHPSMSPAQSYPRPLDRLPHDEGRALTCGSPARV